MASTAGSRAALRRNSITGWNESKGWCMRMSLLADAAEDVLVFAERGTVPGGIAGTKGGSFSSGRSRL